MGFKEELRGFSHAKVTFDQPMKKITALGVGGTAKYFSTAKGRQKKIPPSRKLFY